MSWRSEKISGLYRIGIFWREASACKRNAVECIDGARACPPEDCGGVWGYEDMLQALKNPTQEGNESTSEWLGEGFDPKPSIWKKSMTPCAVTKEPGQRWA